MYLISSILSLVKQQHTRSSVSHVGYHRLTTFVPQDERIDECVANNIREVYFVVHDLLSHANNAIKPFSD